MKKKIYDCSFIRNAIHTEKTGTSFGVYRIYTDSSMIMVERSIMQPLPAMHTHNFFEFDIILDGKGLHVTPDGQSEIGRGTVIFQSPATMHRYINTGSDELQILNIEFSGDFDQVLLTYFRTLYGFSLQLSDEELSALIREAEDVLDENPKCDELFAKGAAYKIIAIIRKRYDLSEKCQPLAKTEQTVLEALLYLHRNYAKKLTITDLAEHISFSPDYLSALIKKYTGRSFKQYLLHVRLEAAFEMIAQGGRSVKSVCTEVGFSSYTNFHYAFKKAFGIRPGELAACPHEEAFERYHWF